MSLRGYPEYQHVGGLWMTSIPRHWRLVPLGRITLDRCDGPFGSAIKSEHYVDSGVRVVRLQNIRAGAFDSTDAAFIDASYYNTDVGGHDVRARDILIAGLGDERNTVGRACVAPDGIEPAMVKADCFRFRLDERVAAPEFVAWALCAGSSADAGVLSTGSTRSRIPLSVMASRQLALPPQTEQKAIISFLDRETTKIDALVAEQERLMALLKEKRQAVISHAVTNGLNPNAPMKASGVEWLGEVPAHWTVVPIRKVAKLESGHTPSRQHPEYWQNCTVPWFTLADVWQIRESKADVVYETKELVSEVGLANSSARLLPAGTVMLSRTASVGFSTIMGVPMATTQDFANWICGARLSPDFLLYVLRSMSGEFRRLMMGSTHNTIYMPDIQSLTLALPPRDEQADIVKYVRRRAVEFEELSAAAQRATDLLLERRAALISAAVTGQIDVRHLATADAA